LTPVAFALILARTGSFSNNFAQPRKKDLTLHCIAFTLARGRFFTSFFHFCTGAQVTPFKYYFTFALAQ
jgi:hypothetical protein